MEAEAEGDWGLRMRWTQGLKREGDLGEWGRGWEREGLWNLLGEEAGVCRGRESWIQG